MAEGPTVRMETLSARPENKGLVLISAHRIVYVAGVFGVVFGLMNTLGGVFAAVEDSANLPLPFLGVCLFGLAVAARKRPSLGTLLGLTVVAALLLFWHFWAFLVDLSWSQGPIMQVGLSFLLTAYCGRHCERLLHLGDSLSTVTERELKAAQQSLELWAREQRKGPERNPYVAASWLHWCRIALLADKAICVNWSATRAFVLDRRELRMAVKRGNAARFTIRLNHPLGRIWYPFDRKNTERLRTWLLSASEPEL